MEVIVRDAKGMLIDSAKFWPNSISNIHPGRSCGFKYPLTEDKRAKNIEISIISVEVW